MQPDPLGLAPGPEFDLIRRFLPGLSRAGGRADVRVGPGDDCAVVVGNGIALSTDMSVEGTHFRRDWLSPREIGHRAAAAALSDVAAMAARPIGVLCSLAAAPGDAGDFAVEVMRGVRDAAERVGAALLGGDLARIDGPMVLDLTVVGEAPEPVIRAGARPGDEVWVTGELGGAAAFVAAKLAGREPHPAARERFARPEPRTDAALRLRALGIPCAMLDLSDGLAGDAGHLAAAGGVAIVLDPDAIPIHPAALAEGPEQALGLAVSGGEDYELCFVAAPGALDGTADELRHAFGVRLTRVGRVEAGSGVWWEGADGARTPVSRGGFQHFGAEEGR